MEQAARPTPTTRRDTGVQMIARAASILRALESAEGGLSLSQLAERTGLPRSTVHRLATALQAEGFVGGVSPGGRIRLGAGLIQMANAGGLALRARLRPAMELLHERLGETVDLSILEGDHVRFVDQITSPHSLRVVSTVGGTFPLHCSPNGRMILALLTAEEREALLPRRLEALTPRTVTDRGTVLEAVEAAGRAGIAFIYEEISTGICAAAIAFRDGGGGYDAISVAAPTARFVGREAEITAAMADARRLIEAS